MFSGSRSRAAIEYLPANSPRAIPVICVCSSNFAFLHIFHQIANFLHNNILRNSKLGLNGLRMLLYTSMQCNLEIHFVYRKTQKVPITFTFPRITGSRILAKIPYWHRFRVIRGIFAAKKFSVYKSVSLVVPLYRTLPIHATDLW